MPTDMKTPSWFLTYKDVVMIAQQPRVSGIAKKDDKSKNNKPLAVVIVNQEIADSFEAYFQDLWKRSRPLK